MDTARLRDVAYDTIPVRDLAFADLSRQSTGPGRALFDGRGVLHVLVPRGDPHEARTIGLQIDQHQSDAGAEPQQVQVHHYEIRPSTQTIELIPEKPAPTSDVRSAYGFVTMRIDEMKGLSEFLTQTRHLSWLEVRGSEVWAGGWNWPDVPAVPLDAEDVSVIQRGYLTPASGRLPGFSLDPGPRETRDDILAVLPDLRPELADRLISRNWKSSAFQSADGLAAVVDGALFHDNPQSVALAEMGLPSDRTQLWALSLLLADRRAYSQARYDGRLEGTKVGMTLFYNDYMAKDWVNGVGSGVPPKASGGFAPDPDVVTPWSHCSKDPQSEYGRLWFGQNDSGFSFDANRVSMGAQTTRLFARTEGERGTEVEPSFAFGRGLRWWDQHYQAVADYEPQYQRLDQIMRWSGALEWLIYKTQSKLPQLDDAAIRSDLRFKDWYTQHDELRERSQIEFVTPPSVTQEAIRSKPSPAYMHCGRLRIVGGVSLGDLGQRTGGRSFHADLPESVRRGGLFDETSHLDPVTGTGQIKQVSIDGEGHVADTLQRTFSSTPDGHAAIDVVANGRREAPFGGLKVWRAEAAPRELKVDLAASNGQVSQRVEFQHQELGELVTRKDSTGPENINTVTIQWRPGILDRARRILESKQNRLVSHPSAGSPLATDGVLYSYQDPGGGIVYKIGGPDDPWLSISNELKPPGEEMAFRLGGPDPRTGKPEFFEGSLSPHPDLPLAGAGHSRWIDVTPATADNPAQARWADPPGLTATSVPVITPDGTTAAVSQVGDHVRVPADDPILGLNGPAEGAALLRDFPRVDEAMRTAAQTKDGLLRGVRLGNDGVALADAEKVILVSSDHPWADRVLRATGDNPSRPPALFRIEGDHILQVDQSVLATVPGSARRTTLGEIWNTGSGDIYVHRSMLIFEKSPILPQPLPLDSKVIVREFVVADPTNAATTASAPDIRIHGSAEWWHVSRLMIRTANSASPSSTSAPTSLGSNSVPMPSGQIYLVCPDANEHVQGCEE
jgi:hypothetical protein